MKKNKQAKKCHVNQIHEPRTTDTSEKSESLLCVHKIPKSHHCKANAHYTKAREIKWRFVRQEQSWINNRKTGQIELDL